MKRKADDAVEASPAPKKTRSSLSTDEAKNRFRKNLFEKDVLDSYTTEYATSSPYKHAVIHDLINDQLLRSVRDEIKANVEFTPKETDIYKIHQSGDLANLDGLDDESLAKLPSLLKLRDAVYSETFRNYVSHITDCGPLSGRKTDMAINVYTPGCYLLCHDDVIGSRRVSYILYLTDPDTPWQSEWGGALRLYPVQEIENEDGQIAKTPLPDAVKTIPPAWNQLSFFAVQPGESFHDVEEVYHAESKAALEEQGGRVRMAISGWFHIPQIGEDGYVEGEEEKNAKNSSLMQLQGNPAQYDRPQSRPVKVLNVAASEAEFEQADLEFLLRYMAPVYLTPDTLEQINEYFEENSSICLSSILSKRFAARLREEVERQELKGVPADQKSIEEQSAWKVALPPHKHRYLYQHPIAADELRTSHEETPITELLDHFLPSRQFRHWLQVATGCTIETHDVVARRFRRGKDYTLATGYEGIWPRLEVNLGFTPTQGWGEDDQTGEAAPDEPTAGANEEENATDGGESEADSKGKGKAKAVDAPPESVPSAAPVAEKEEVGGHEVFMAGDEAEDKGGEDGADGEDAAVYKSSGDEDNILFFQAAAWNKMTIVLRDHGTLKFVKYVSQHAKGDRWDVSANFEIEPVGDEGSHEGGPAAPGFRRDEEDEDDFDDLNNEDEEDDSDSD